MIYKRLKGHLLTLLKAPQRPPDPPAGSPESVQVFRADPKFLTLQIVVWGAGFAAAIVAELVFLAVGIIQSVDSEEQWAEVALAVTLLVLTMAGSVVKYFLIRLDYDMRYYVVTDRSLRIREGAVIINEATFTYANVQNLKIHQGPVERLLGLSNLVVETAGGAGSSSRENKRSPFHVSHEGVLRGIADARQVRDQILVLLKRYRDAGLGDPEERERETPRHEGFPPVAIERFREIRDELRLLGS